MLLAAPTDVVALNFFFDTLLFCGAILLLAASTGRILADSGEGNKSEQECKADIDRVKGSASAPVVETKAT